jgi:succinyl-CoA synthetase beta subunit/citryl-CoA synthetase large subunit
MRLYEFEGKKLFKEWGLPVPEGELVEREEELLKGGKKIGFPLVAKVQVLKGGRGKAGGVKLINDENELLEFGKKFFREGFLGKPIKGILLEKKLDVEKEFYLGITIDELAKRNCLLFTEGGMDVEEIARSGRVLKLHIDPFTGLKGFLTKGFFAKEFKGKTLLDISEIAVKLYHLYIKMDATMAEINPLILTKEQKFFCADSRIEIDDDALVRQKGNLERFNIPLREEKEREPTELEIKASGIDQLDHRGVAGRVVEFDGDIALIIGGGGASLTVFDAILRYGGKPANYCEIGGNPTVKKVQKLTELLLSKKGIKGVAVITNVLSNTRVDLVARGVIKGMLARGIDPSKFPVVFRVPGSWEEEGFKILEKYGIKYFTRDQTMDEAAKYIVELLKKEA